MSMPLKSHTIILTLLTVAFHGCSASPWASRKHTSDPPKASQAQSTDQAHVIPPPPGTSGSIQQDPKALERVLAEVQQSGALDKADQDKLAEDLKQTDPSLWPLVVQQFRAAMAYRKQREQPLAAQGDINSVVRPSLLPPVGDFALAASLLPQGNYPITPFPSFVLSNAINFSGTTYLADRIADERPPQEGASHVVAASYQTTAGDWQTSLAGVIRSMESTIGKSNSPQEEIAAQARLRLLNLMAGRRDAALQPIAAADPAVQDFWSKELYGLATWLDTQRIPDGPRRTAETKQVLDEALVRLGEAAPLVVRNPAFCTDVLSYGCIRQFKSNEFLPEQDVILYFELDNFISEPTPKGFHTRLRSSYQIFDSRGQRVGEHEFPISEEYCQNARHDFFIACQFRLPGRIYPGKHTLQLTIEDLQGQKVGQSSIEFTIKESEGKGAGDKK
jgi:hypothetical protein